MVKLVSFDVYGTLIDIGPTGVAAFRTILDAAGAPSIDPARFHRFWEERNIAHYYDTYRPYKEIGRLSLEEAFRHFGVSGGSGELIDHYFARFPEMPLYPDVVPVFEKLAGTHRLAVVSNIDDDLLRATRLPSGIDLVCTAERARGYKPDGTLFRHLIAQAGTGVREILHCGQSQFTDMVGAKPLGLTVAWINRRSLDLHPSVPPPDFVFPGIAPLLPLLGIAA